MINLHGTCIYLTVFGLVLARMYGVEHVRVMSNCLGDVAGSLAVAKREKMLDVSADSR